MINLVLSIAISLVTTLVFGFLFGAGDFSIIAGAVPGLIALAITYLVLMRRTLKQVEAIMGRAQVEMMELQKLAESGKQPSKKKLNDTIDRAIAVIKEGFPHARWQFLVREQLNGQIGSLLYTARRFDEALPYLRNSFLKHWLPQAMLATILFRKRDYDAMKEAFERGVEGNPKESIMWGVYAWCLWKNKERDAAIEVLARGKDKLNNDARINDNLLALQNDRKMDMSPWGEAWYQLQLEKPPHVWAQHQMMKEAQAKGLGGMRARGPKRSVYR